MIPEAASSPESRRRDDAAVWSRKTSRTVWVLKEEKERPACRGRCFIVPMGKIRFPANGEKVHQPERGAKQDSNLIDPSPPPEGDAEDSTLNGSTSPRDDGDDADGLPAEEGPISAAAPVRGTSRRSGRAAPSRCQLDPMQHGVASAPCWTRSQHAARHVTLLQQ